jgi:hypothetical protein
MDSRFRGNEWNMNILMLLIESVTPAKAGVHVDGTPCRRK